MAGFTTDEKQDVFTVLCPADIDSTVSKELSVLVKNWAMKGPTLHILDFKDVFHITNVAYRPFVLYNQLLKSYKKYLATINMSPTVAQQVTSAGLDSVFNPAKTVEEARKRFGLAAGGAPKNFSVDVEFVNPFVSAAQVTLKVQANTALRAGKPRLKKPEEPFDIGIAGVISLVSDRFKGSIALCFPSKVFLNIYEAMVGEKHESITQEIEDAAGELLNIIFGQAKAELNNKKGYVVQKAIPTVLSGENLKVHHITRSAAIILPFETELGSFHIEIIVDPE